MFLRKKCRLEYASKIFNFDFSSIFAQNRVVYETHLTTNRVAILVYYAVFPKFFLQKHFDTDKAYQRIEVYSFILGKTARAKLH